MGSLQASAAGTSPQALGRGDASEEVAVRPGRAQRTGHSERDLRCSGHISAAVVCPESPLVTMRSKDCAAAQSSACADWGRDLNASREG